MEMVGDRADEGEEKKASSGAMEKCLPALDAVGMEERDLCEEEEEDNSQASEDQNEKKIVGNMFSNVDWVCREEEIGAINSATKNACLEGGELEMVSTDMESRDRVARAEG